MEELFSNDNLEFFIVVLLAYHVMLFWCWNWNADPKWGKVDFALKKSCTWDSLQQIWTCSILEPAKMIQVLMIWWAVWVWAYLRVYQKKTPAPFHSKYTSGTPGVPPLFSWALRVWFRAPRIWTSESLNSSYPKNIGLTYCLNWQWWCSLTGNYV